MYTDLHPFVAPAIITITVISLWRRLLMLVLTVLVVAIAIGLYEIVTFIRH
ncbi:MAG: hypothetical protein ACR2FU_18335 [Streptosporangiaceae bacterium]